MGFGNASDSTNRFSERQLVETAFDAHLRRRGQQLVLTFRATLLLSPPSVRMPTDGTLYPGLIWLGDRFTASGQVKRDVDEHVFLAADHAAPSSFFEQRARVKVVARGGRFGMTQETGMHPGVARASAFCGRRVQAGPVAGGRCRRRHLRERVGRSRGSSRAWWRRR